MYEPGGQPCAVGLAEHQGERICVVCGAVLTDEEDYADEHDMCPMGCGRTTEDPYGGPCSKCWDAAP